jgi:hypothetical protein
LNETNASPTVISYPRDGSHRGAAVRVVSVLLRRRTGVANILGINFSGFIAWWLWRSIYLSKLPRAEKKLRVALDWALDLLFSKDLVQFNTFPSPTISGPGDPH